MNTFLMDISIILTSVQNIIELFDQMIYFDEEYQMHKDRAEKKQL